MEINSAFFPQLLEEDSKRSIKNLYTYFNELLLMSLKNQNKFFLSYVWATDFQNFAFLISLSASCKLLICNYAVKHIKQTNNSVSFFHQPYLVHPILYRNLLLMVSALIALPPPALTYNFFILIPDCNSNMIT